MKSKLTSQRVVETVRSCLYPWEELRQGEPPKGAVVVHGLVNSYGFDPKRLSRHKETIREMLNELHPTFKEGWSFLNACLDKDGGEWTSEHRVMEMLLLLGEASGMVTCLLPRDQWNILPGAMPYYRVNTLDESDVLDTLEI